MTPSGADPLPAVAEVDATGEIAAIYADIRATLGVPMVNLIWCHLAATDGALAWAWRAARPLHAGGAVAETAAAFRDRIALPPVPALAPDALAAVGLGDADCATVGRLLVSYDRANTMNFVTLGALRATMRGEAGGAAAARPAGRPPGAPVSGPLPPLPPLESLDPALLTLVRRLNAVGAEDDTVVASLYRHLALWPGLLALIDTALAPLAGSTALHGLIAANREAGLALARGLVGAARPEPPPAAVSGPVGDALDAFLAHTLGRMVTMGRLLRAIIPA